MKRIIANIADSYGLYDLHKKFSKEDQFSYVEKEVLELNSDFLNFYAKPFLPRIHFREESKEKEYKKGKLEFLSQVENQECNEKAVFHYERCTEPNNNNNKNNNVNVILIHGWRADNLNRLEKVFLDSFKERRYNIYNYILPFHMERCEITSLYSGEHFVSANVNRTLKSMQQAVSDVRVLIKYIKQIKKDKVIIVGLSLGGIVSNLLGEVEENIDALISLFYGNDLSFTVFETEAGKYMKKDFLKNNFNYALLSKSWDIINPCSRKPILEPNKIFLISGKYDKYVLNKDTDKLWENWGRPQIHKYNCGHSGIVIFKNKVKNDTLKFIDKRV